MRRVEFHPEAQTEFASAARFYEEQRRGLGLDFTLTIQQTYERLMKAFNGQSISLRGERSA